MSKILKIELINNEKVIIPEVKPEVVRDIREWIDGDEQFYTLVMGQTISILNKEHIVKITLY